MAENKVNEIIDKLSAKISSDSGNMHEDELDQITTAFNQTLLNALKTFNSSTFDDDGFIKKMRSLDLDNGKDKDMVKNVLNNLTADYINVETLNHSELLLRRDISNICTQMPEMHDVINVVRDAIIECNVSTGEVSRSLIFENRDSSEAYEAQVREFETSHKLLMAIKNFIVPNTLKAGEMYIQIVPYAKLFAELESIHDSRTTTQSRRTAGPSGHINESVSSNEYLHESVSLYSDKNLKTIMESVSPSSKSETSDMYAIENSAKGSKMTSNPDSVTKECVSKILHNIDVYRGASTLYAEYGAEGLKDLLVRDYKESVGSKKTDDNEHARQFLEGFGYNDSNSGLFADIDQDGIDFKHYSDVKGCYIKYLDSLRIIPIRMDRRVIGYYYVTTTTDLQANPANPNGIVDLSYQTYTRDRNMVETLSNMIIQSFDKKMLEKNIKLKNEIAEIIMAHRFSEGKLTFIYIPENEVVRLVINEDEEGKGHSILEPTLFPARMYLMLTMYNMMYILNNNTTRVHYVKSSGLNKDYAAQIQRTMRKFQSRRITIDDIYSYSGVLNKIGGMGEMVLPSGRNDYKAIETDTIEAVNNPINIEFLEQQRRQAISGTGAPHLLIINAIDEVDFAKTLEMANTRFLSTVSSYKIDFNNGLTKLYQMLMKYCTDIDDDIIHSFRFKFNAVKIQDIQITADMINNFNNVVELVGNIYYAKGELEDDKGNLTPKGRYLRRFLAEKYMPQLFDDIELDDMIKKVDAMSVDDQLQDKVDELSIDKEDLEEINDKKK